MSTMPSERQALRRLNPDKLNSRLGPLLAPTSQLCAPQQPPKRVNR